MSARYPIACIVISRPGSNSKKQQEHSLRSRLSSLASSDNLIQNGGGINSNPSNLRWDRQEALKGREFAISQIVLEVHAGVNVNGKLNDPGSQFLRTSTVSKGSYCNDSLVWMDITISSSVWLVPLG